MCILLKRTHVPRCPLYESCMKFIHIYSLFIYIYFIWSLHEICGLSAAREMDPSFALGRQTRCHILHISKSCKMENTRCIINPQESKESIHSQYENEKTKMLWRTLSWTWDTTEAQSNVASIYSLIWPCCVTPKWFQEVDQLVSTCSNFFLEVCKILILF